MSNENKLDEMELYLSKPEEELRAPKSLSASGLKTMKSLIAMAKENRMMSEEDSARALAIITTNPHIRISKLFRRLSVIEDTLSLGISVDRRMATMLENTREELEILKDVSEPLSVEEKLDA